MTTSRSIALGLAAFATTLTLMLTQAALTGVPLPA